MKTHPLFLFMDRLRKTGAEPDYDKLKAAILTAAPEMLKALKDMLFEIENKSAVRDILYPELITIIKEAVAKAEGRVP